MCERETNSLYKSRKSSHHLARGIRTQLTHWLPFPRGLFSKNLYLLFGKRPTLTQTHKHIYFIYIYETYLSHRPSKQEQQELLSTYGKSGWHQQPQAHSHITSHQVTQYKTQDPSQHDYIILCLVYDYVQESHNQRQRIIQNNNNKNPQSNTNRLGLKPKSQSEQQPRSIIQEQKLYI